MMQKKAIILASGGIDSMTVIGIMIDKGLLPIVLSFDYGQNNLVELECLKKSLQQFECYPQMIHKIISINSDFILGFSSDESDQAALIDKSIKVEKYNNINELPKNIPTTYVPGRNTIFLSYALGLADYLNISEIYLGIHQQDSGNYPDCTPSYLKAMNDLSQCGFKNKISILAPLIDMNKTQIVARGKQLNVDYSNTISCYDPIGNQACHHCLSCIIRDEALKANGLPID